MASNAPAGHTCPPPMKATSNGVFQGDSPLHFALPLAILQICIVVIATRVLAYVLKPLRQPRVIAEIVGGILLGPSALGRNKSYLQAIFPPKSITVLDTLANLGLLFFLFLAGVEIDPKSIRQTGKQALAIAVAGITLPFALGIGSSFVLRETIAKGVDATAFLVFMGVALSITAFPVLARILAELKLLTTDIGKMAMSAATVNDVAAWILLALAVALSGSNQSPLVSLWVFLSGCEPVDEIYVCATLTAVLAAGFITDTIGIHAMFGAFVVGVLVPKEGPFAGALVEKVEDLISGLFLPGFSCGVFWFWSYLLPVSGRFLGRLWCLSCKLPVREALALGFLMNSKGLMELIVLNIGKDRKVLNDQTFAIMVLMALFTTFITTPLVVAVYKPEKRGRMADYKHKTIERKNTNTQLKILACFHSARNIPSIINLLEASRGTNKSDGLCVYAMHLKEFSERSSAILMVHKARRNGLPFWNKGQQSNSDNVVVAFEAYQQLSRVSIRPMTEISSVFYMREDICATAESKRVAIVILPFHKHQRLDGTLETTRNDFRLVNQKVLQHAPCSVGILVDRGLGGATHIAASNVSYFITVLFFGGRDDREALAYGAPMAEHPGISLMVIHFLVEPEVAGEFSRINIDDNGGTKAGSVDEEFLTEFKQKTAMDDSITYEEKVVRNEAQTIAVIREIGRCNLFLVGRTPCGEVALALNRRSEWPELGPVGSLLISPGFPTPASVLVVQQYNCQVSLNLTSEMEEELPE
ncbi:hypothetical protein ACFX14_038179 [Malus domestica]